MSSAKESTGLDLEELKALYQNKTGNRYGDFIDNEKQYTLRQWDGMDGCWTDCRTGGAEQVLAEWWKYTEAGTKNTAFDSIDYYRIFPADTKMHFAGSNEMFREPEHPDPEIDAEVQADEEVAERVDALVARISELEAENRRLKTPTKSPRAEVIAFMQQMEERLSAFDDERGPDGWKGALTAKIFFDRMQHKLDELKEKTAEYETLHARKTPRQSVGEQRILVLAIAADLGNYAMMVSDVCGALPLAQPTPTDISNLRMREALKAARAHIMDALGTQRDEEIEAHIKEIDDALGHADG